MGTCVQGEYAACSRSALTVLPLSTRRSCQVLILAPKRQPTFSRPIIASVSHTSCSFILPCDAHYRPCRMEGELSTYLCNDPFDQPAHCSIMQMTCLHYPIHQSTRSAFRRRRDIHRYSSSSMYRLFLSFALQAENCFLPSGSCSKRLGTSS